MSYIVVDVEADGEYPVDYSIVCFGAVIVEPSLKYTFYGEMKPISDYYKPEALAISGFTREQHLGFNSPEKVMNEFRDWVEINSIGKPIFISDNLAFDWQFINSYLHKFTGGNPFGFSGKRIGCLWGGYKNNPSEKWKHMRRTKHTHNPVDDALGNAEALLEMKNMGLNINLK